MGDKGGCIGIRVYSKGRDRGRTSDATKGSQCHSSLTRPFVALNSKTTCSGGVMVLALHRTSNARRYNATAGLSRVLQC
jgi:hypothetical protein